MAGQIYQPHITSYDYDCPISEAGGMGSRASVVTTSSRCARIPSSFIKLPRYPPMLIVAPLLAVGKTQT